MSEEDAAADSFEAIQGLLNNDETMTVYFHPSPHRRPQNQSVEDHIRDACSTLRAQDSTIKELTVSVQRAHLPSDDSARALADALKESSSVVKLELFGATTQAYLALSPGIAGSSTLKTVRVNGGDGGVLDATNIKILAESVRRNPRLEELQINGYFALGDAELLLLLEALYQDHFCRLKKLHFSALSISRKSFSALAELYGSVSERGAPLVGLRLETLLFQDEDARAFAKALIKSGPKELTLRQMLGWGDEGLAAMGDMLKKNDQLRRLTVSFFPNATAAGMTALVDGLLCNNTIFELNLVDIPAATDEMRATIQEHCRGNQVLSRYNPETMSRRLWPHVFSELGAPARPSALFLALKATDANELFAGLDANSSNEGRSCKKARLSWMGAAAGLVYTLFSR